MLTTSADNPKLHAVTTTHAKIFQPSNSPDPFLNTPFHRCEASPFSAKKPVAIIPHIPAPQCTPTHPTGSSILHFSNPLMTRIEEENNKIRLFLCVLLYWAFGMITGGKKEKKKLRPTDRNIIINNLHRRINLNV